MTALFGIATFAAMLFIFKGTRQERGMAFVRKWLTIASGTLFVWWCLDIAYGDGRTFVFGTWAILLPMFFVGGTLYWLSRRFRWE